MNQQYRNHKSILNDSFNDSQGYETANESSNLSNESFDFSEKISTKIGFFAPNCSNFVEDLKPSTNPNIFQNNKTTADDQQDQQAILISANKYTEPDSFKSSIINIIVDLKPSTDLNTFQNIEPFSIDKHIASINQQNKNCMRCKEAFGVKKQIQCIKCKMFFHKTKSCAQVPSKTEDNVLLNFECYYCINKHSLTLLNCNKCGNQIHTKELIICCKCKKHFHYSKGCLKEADGRKKKPEIWACQICVLALKDNNKYLDDLISENLIKFSVLKIKGQK